MELYNLSPAAGSTKEAFRKGRGHGSGNGKTGGREQMVMMLYRYARYKGCDVSVGEDTNILSFFCAYCASKASSGSAKHLFFYA